jgi:thiamine-monophosphate kinase
LLLLKERKKVFQVNPQSQPDFAGYDYLFERQLKPEPRFDIIKSLKKSNIQPSAMTHVTHGLVLPQFIYVVLLK